MTPQDMADVAQGWEARAKKAEARIAELEANLRYTAESWAKRCARLDNEYTRLLKAFAAYRSALRSGEPESPELTALGEEALSSRRVPGE